MRVRTAGWLLAGALALGACDGDATSDQSGSVVSERAESTAASSVPDAPGGGTVVSRTTPPSSGSVATSAATTNGAVTTNSADTTGAATGDWCRLATELNLLTTAFRHLDAADTAEVERALGEILDRLSAIEAAVPSVLAADFPVSAEAFRLLDEALAAVDYDLTAADLTELDARTEEIQAANERIRRYNHDECGLDAGVTGSEAP